ncbi:alpha/beta fold hydrolase [Desertimonas flava]|uniref:alpha/beta fold hydrolase n=1 Tax=Desertimonas flava TaxID=2064846 RepID=UPI0013C48C30|nr:alpha/beta fold hydrolase [Desertimonas flava]
MADLSQRITIDGAELAWDSWGEGDGPPLLLIHGFSGSSHDFALVVDELARTRRVLAVDHVGHGLSTKLGAAGGYSLSRLAADVGAFVDAVVGGPVDVLGHSMGGYLSMLLVLDRPELVRSLTLMDTSGWGFAAGEVQELMQAFLAGFDPANHDRPVNPPGPERALVDAATPAEWRDVKALRDEAFDLYALKALGLELLGPDLPSLREPLGGVTVPVTVIVGSEDGELAVQAPDLAACFPNGELVTIAGAYHSPQLTHRDEWLTAVERHLSR